MFEEIIVVGDVVRAGALSSVCVVWLGGSFPPQPQPSHRHFRLDSTRFFANRIADDIRANTRSSTVRQLLFLFLLRPGDEF
jgi:hypothetical protein